MTTQNMKAQTVHLAGAGNDFFANKRSVGGKDDFVSVMNKNLEQNVSDSKSDFDTTKSTKSDSDATKTFDQLQKTDNKMEVKESNAVEQNPSMQEQNSINENQEALSKQEAKIIKDIETVVKETIKEQLDIDDEQLENIMSQLAFTVLDLLNNGNLQALVLENANVEDVTAILTDSELSKQFTQLTKAFEAMDTTETFDISKEELTKLLEKVENLGLHQNELPIDKDLTSELVVEMPQEEWDQQTNPFTITEDNDFGKQFRNKTFEQDADSINQETIKATVVENEVTKVHIKEDIKVAEGNAKEDIMPQISDVAVKSVNDKEVDHNNNKVQEVETVSEDKMITITKEKQNTKDFQGNEQSKKENNNTSGKTEKGLSLEQFIQNLSGNKIELPEQFANQVEHLEQMRQIVNQVVEQIKLVVKPDATSMELQLNPENLGKVSLSVVAKDGHMTASFVAQNEMAKHAIESQVQVLKENLSNQGIKVDAIEVTVSNFGFEQNAQTDGRQQQGNQKKQPRRINLDHLEAGLGELGEEEQLATKVMEANGGHVDYSA